MEVCSLNRDGEGRSPLVLVIVTWYYVPMKKIVFIALVLLVTVGCGEEDLPMFAESQVTALVIEKASNDLVMAKSLDLDVAWEESCYYLEMALFAYPHTTTFEGIYQGNGIWAVSLSESVNEEIFSNLFLNRKVKWLWKVYESTATVESLGTHKTFDDTNTIVPRHIC